MSKKKKLIIVAAAAVFAIAAIVVGVKLYNEKRLGLVETTAANEELKDYRFEKYENLEFECDVPTDSIDKVYTFSIANPDGKFEDEQFSKKLLADMASKRFSMDIKESDIINDDGALKYEYESDDGSKKIFADLFADGTFLLNDDIQLMKTRYGSEQSAAAPFIHLWNGFDDVGEVTLNGKAIDIKDFAKAAEGEVRRCCEGAFNEGEDIRLYDAVKVKRTDDGIEYITFRFIHVLEGLAVNEGGYAGAPDSGRFVFPSFVAVEMSDDKTISSVSNYFYYIIRDKKSVDKIVPLSRATELLSKQLAPYFKNKVTNVGLKYVNITEQGKEESELRPMWCYTLDEMPGGYGEPSNYFITHNAYVDAQTGDVYLSNSKEQTFEEIGFE